ncbi:MAG: DUF4352 domain-containing protein [Pseudomonadota bacterium]
MKARIFWIIQLFIYCGLFVPTHGITADQILCDKFSIIAKINNRTLTYSLETDLPDSANVIVSISRSYSRKDVRETNSKDYYNSKKTVGQLRFVNIVKLDDNQWCQTLAKQQKLMAKMRNPFGVDKVNDDISISITFHINQEDPRFEKQNQNVSGKMIDEKNPIRSIRAEKKILLPLAIKYDPENIPQEIEVAIPKPLPTSNPPPYHSKNVTSTPKHSSAITDSIVYKPGETVSIGYTSYEVLKCEWRSSLSNNKYLEQKPDAEYLFLEIVITNNDKKPRTIPAFKLIDENGSEYETCSKAWRVKDYIGSLESLNPGVSKRGIIVFDVPSDNTYNLKVSGGFWSKETALIEVVTR